MSVTMQENVLGGTFPWGQFCGEEEPSEEGCDGRHHCPLVVLEATPARSSESPNKLIGERGGAQRSEKMPGRLEDGGRTGGPSGPVSLSQGLSDGQCSLRGH